MSRAHPAAKPPAKRAATKPVGQPAKKRAKKPATRIPGGGSNVVRVSVERGAAATGLTSAGLKKRGERMLDVLDLQGVELSIALVSDETIRGLNASYRKKNKPTDVLSFPMLDDASAFAISSNAAGARMLGDVIMSTPTATRQAKERKSTLADEIEVLLSHGVLHLLGFDHGTDDEEREMNAYAAVLAAAAVSRLPMRLKLVPVARR